MAGRIDSADKSAAMSTAKLTYGGAAYRCFFFSSRRRHTRFDCDWSSDVCSSDLAPPQAKGQLQPGVDGYTLTGDGNIIHVRATLTYRITDPISYVFNFANATNLLEHALDNALFYASARFTADDAVYRNKLAFQVTVLARVRQPAEKLNLTIAIEPREVRTEPPAHAAEAFNNLRKAQSQGDIKIQVAE